MADQDRIRRQIVQRLSLRAPQERSLEILADVVDRIGFGKETDPVEALETIKEAYPSVEDFERQFPSLCFALATGVGKTRLMGAFVSYLFLTGRSKNFFVLAPNTTIHDKLIADFSNRTSPKYVFRGIAEFARNPPIIVTGDSWQEGAAFEAPTCSAAMSSSTSSTWTRSTRTRARSNGCTSISGNPISTIWPDCPISS